MSFITFDGRYKVGHAVIDRQPAGLFDAVNKLHDAMKSGAGREEIGRTLAFLRTYTVEHFSAEEASMRES